MNHELDIFSIVLQSRIISTITNFMISAYLYLNKAIIHRLLFLENSLLMSKVLMLQARNGFYLAFFHTHKKNSQNLKQLSNNLMSIVTRVIMGKEVMRRTPLL